MCDRARVETGLPRPSCGSRGKPRLHTGYVIIKFDDTSSYRRSTASLSGHYSEWVVEHAGSSLHDLLGSNKKLFVVTVPPVRKRWGKKLMDSLSHAGFEAKIVTMPDGERHKKIATVETLAEQLVKLGAERSAVLVALGGGIVGDVTGFLAAIYLRGIEVVQIPTTVLAQVDASIGGKTGVNLKAGKNLVGSFHHPRAV